MAGRYHGRLIERLPLARFRKAGPVERFRDGRGRQIVIDGVKVAVFRRGERFHAFTDACPHMGASLADGRLVGNRVECHWHHWTYGLDDGRSDAREWACIAIYETRVEDGELLIGIPDPESKGTADEDDPGWFKWDPDKGRKVDG